MHPSPPHPPHPPIPQTGSLLHTLSSHSHRITALLPIPPPTTHPSPNASSEPQWLVSADYGCQVSVWDLGGASDDADVAPIEVAKWQDHSDWRYFGVLALCGWEGGVVYTGGGDRVVKAWSMRDFSLTARLEGHRGPVSALHLDAELLYSASWDASLRLWWRADHSPLATLEGGVGIRALAGVGGRVMCGREDGVIQVGWE